MEVTGVRFETFKSLYDVDCDLDHFTVITGPNGSGKSNFVDALNFIGEVYEDGLEFAVAKAGGYDNIAHRRSRRAKRAISVEIECVVTVADMLSSSLRFGFPSAENFRDVDPGFALTYRHFFSLATSSQAALSDYEVKEDVVEVFEGKRRLLRVERALDDTLKITVTQRALTGRKWLIEMLDPYSDARYAKFLQERKISPISLFVERQYFSGIFGPIREALSGIRVFQLSPYQLRTAGIPSPNAVLERHGENLPGAANHLKRNDVRAWRQVEAGMRSILPDLLSIDVAYTEDRRLALQFKEAGVGRAWNTGEVSDGTIQALALLLALYDERNPLLVIEEPENAIHPWILRQFLDLCQAVPNKQLIMTTHSPVLLNYVSPKIVRLMSIFQGRSHIARLVDMTPELKSAVVNGELSLFDFYDSGVLSQTVPRGFQGSHELEDE